MREIGIYAFYDCKSLKQVTFAKDSKVEKIGKESFYKSGIERIVIPRSAVEI